MKKKMFGILLALVLGITTLSVPVSASTRVDDLISGMSLREKIGQLIMPDFRNWTLNGKSINVTETNDEINQIIADYKFGGIILFAENVVETEQTARLTNSLQQVAKENNVLPLLLTIDQEGGKVVRLGTGTSLPGNMALGATRSGQDAYNAGTIIAEELSSLDLNVNFAPTLDTNNNPNNPVIGERSFSSDPNIVAELGVEYINGLQDNNIIAAAKHFPGHGDTAVDSHSGLPMVDKTYAEIQEMELVPFQAAIDSGVDMIMTAHISFPKIETETFQMANGDVATLPATLSKTILTDILRVDMGYDGVVITDALNMKAISDNFTELDATLKVLQAGGDIALMPTILRSPADVSKLETIYAGIEAAVNSNELPIERIDESVKRVLQLKEDRGILDFANDTRTVDEKVANALNVVGSKEHRALEREITQHSITVGVNKDYTLPLKPQAGEKVVILTPYNNEIPAWKYGYDRLLREEIVSQDAEFDVIRFSGTTTQAELETAIEGADYVLAVSELSASSYISTHWLVKQPELIVNLAKAQGSTAVILSIGKPYDMIRYPEADAVLLAYGAKGMDPTEAGQDPTKTYGPNIPTSLDIVFGKVDATGTLPVDVMELDANNKLTDTVAYPVGYGLTNITTLEEAEVSLKTTLDSVLRGKQVTVTADLTAPESLISGGYNVEWTYDEEVFIEVERTINSITLEAIADVEDTLVEVSSFKDSKDREFTLASSATVNVSVFSYDELVDKVNSLFGENDKVLDSITLEEVNALIEEVNEVSDLETKNTLLSKLSAAKKTIEIRETDFKGIPETIKVGDTITLTPHVQVNSEDKGWTFDTDHLQMAVAARALDNTSTSFLVLKEGSTTITYTDKDGDVQSSTITILAKDEEKPTDNGGEKPTDNGGEKHTDNGTGTPVDNGSNLPSTGQAIGYTAVIATSLMIVGFAVYFISKRRHNIK